MNAPVRNQEEQFRREQTSQGLHNHLGRNFGSGHEERQAQALACAVVGEDQNGDPSQHNRQLGPLLPESQALLLPCPIQLFSLRHERLALATQDTPGVILGGAFGRCGCRRGAGWGLMRGSHLLPGRIFQLATLADGPTLVRKLGLFLAQGAFLRFEGLDFR